MVLGYGFQGWPIKQCHSNLSELSLVAIATKFGIKWAITRLLLKIPARSLHLWEVFREEPSNTANKILHRPTLVAMAMKFETKRL